jgi:hypothetical protein
MQLPFMHCLEGGQATPQAPQFALSVLVLTHWPPQYVPDGHTQEAAMQTAPPVHSMPQWPQLPALEPRSTHVPQQSTAGGGHAHAPPTQACPLLHAMPQPPQ